MSLEAISGAGYQETKVTVKPRVETSAGQGTDAAAISITEMQSAGRATTTNSTGKEQNNRQNNGQNSGQNNGQSNGQNNVQKNGLPSEQQIKDVISKANNQLKAHRTKCEFSYHEETKRVSIKVLDSDTQEVIREIPPEKSLEMIEKMWEMAGLLIDEKR